MITDTPELRGLAAGHAMDLTFLNSCLMGAVILVLMVCCFALRRQIGAGWIVLGFEVLLGTLLLRRLDEMLHPFGLHLIDAPLNLILSWLAVFVLGIGLRQVWRRRIEIRRAETRLRRREAELEDLRQRAEHGIDWSLPVKRIL